MELGSLKIAGLLQSYTDIRSQFSELHSRFSSLQEAKKKTEAELSENLLKEKEESKRAKLEADKALRSLSVSNKSLKEIRDSLEKREAELKAKNELLLKSNEDRDACLAELRKAVSSAFENAIAQIKFLNPTAELNLEGMHPLGYVSDGKLVPPAAEPSGTVVEEDDLGAEVEIESGPGINSGPQTDI